MNPNVKVKVKILKEGDNVLNVWPSELGYCIAVRQKDGEVYVCSLTLDENKNPRIENTPSLTITFGNNEVEADIETADGSHLKVHTA